PLGHDREDLGEGGERVAAGDEVPLLPPDRERPDHLGVAHLEPSEERVDVDLDRVGHGERRGDGLDEVATTVGDQLHGTAPVTIVTTDRGTWARDVGMI